MQIGGYCMKYVKVIRRAVKQGFEDDINKTLADNEQAKLIDMKVSAVDDEGVATYLAVLVFEK